MVCCIKSKG